MRKAIERKHKRAIDNNRTVYFSIEKKTIEFKAIKTKNGPIVNTYKKRNAAGKEIRYESADEIVFLRNLIETQLMKQQYA